MDELMLFGALSAQRTEAALLRGNAVTERFGLTAHSQIHTHLGAFAHEMSFETFHNFGIFYNTVADMMLSNELKSFTVINDFFEFRSRNSALRTTFGSLITFVYITAYGADKFLFHNVWILGFNNRSLF